MLAGPVSAGHVIAAPAKEVAAVPGILGAAEVVGRLAGGWERVQYDSRAVGKGDLFVAVKGARTDGHEFLRA